MHEKIRPQGIDPNCDVWYMRLNGDGSRKMKLHDLLGCCQNIVIDDVYTCPYRIICGQDRLMSTMSGRRTRTNRDKSGKARKDIQKKHLP